MAEGVSKGFEKKLEIEGVGFKAMADVEGLTLNVGFTNPVKIKKPEGIDFLVEKNVITVSGINKELVGHVASLVRKAKKAEPYKGKGIKYQGEKIRRKEPCSMKEVLQSCSYASDMYFEEIEYDEEN